MIITRIKFYADTIKGDLNKLFCYSCNELQFQEFFNRQFNAGHVIRAAWFEKIEEPGKKVIENIRFTNKSLQEFLDFYLSTKQKNKRIEIDRQLYARQSLIDAALYDSQLLTESINKILNNH